MPAGKGYGLLSGLKDLLTKKKKRKKTKAGATDDNAQKRARDRARKQREQLKQLED